MMNAQQPKQQRTVLTADGELQPMDAAEAEPRLDSIYCTQCGTANHVHSRFCRTCGQSLEDQIEDEPTYGVPGRKLKRSELSRLAMQPRPASDPSSAALEILTLLIVGAMVIATWAISANVIIVLGILVAWMVVEMARHGAMK